MFGQAIKRIRESKSITQDSLARKLGVTRQAICMWEANRREVRASTLNRIAMVLNVSISQIMHPQGVNKGKEAIDMAGKKQTAKKKKVTFELMAPEAKNVLLAGDFNSWDTSSITLKKSKKGLWKTSTTLTPGRYEYKFVVDGEWWTDPGNPDTVQNTYGGVNSVKSVTS